ncbi:MAG TPA: hypothetical protein VHE35_09440 [Kofleriaceae bacterium]|nr:hypothetical protein [Kofleriaceae bacterium]
MVRRAAEVCRARFGAGVGVGVGVGVLAVALAACGSGGASNDTDARVFGDQCVSGGTFDLDGRAAVLGTLNVHVDASGLVEVDTTAELLIALDLVQHGTAVDVVASACAIQIPDVPIAGQDRPIHFEVPQATVASVAGVTGRGTLSSADQTCATLTTDQFVLVLGAVLEPRTIATSPLPEADASGNFRFCPPSIDTPCNLAIGANCACDQEADEKPGATVRASNVPAVDLDEVYVTLRTRFSLAGQVFSSDLMIGDIDASLEQGILGCHLANGGPCTPAEVGAVKNLNPVVTQQPGNPSSFRAVRVPPGTTCAQLIAQRDTLFPR